MGGSITAEMLNGAAEANIYGDPEAAAIVFNAGWMVHQVGSDVGERTIITRKYLADLQSLHGPERRLHRETSRLLPDAFREERVSGRDVRSTGGGVVIDPTLVTSKTCTSDVETRGEFYARENVANRMGSNEKQRAARKITTKIEGVIDVKPNARVCLASMQTGFLQIVHRPIKGK